MNAKLEFRYARLLWLVLFLVPLTAVAGKFCWIPLVDPLYRATLYMHENLGSVLLLVAIAACCVAMIKSLRARAHVRQLLALSAPAPERLCTAFALAAEECGISDFDLAYVDIELAICAVIDKRTICVSKGFVSTLDSQELYLVARHEIAHLLHRDHGKALAWHFFFAALLVPGFEPLEFALREERERNADAFARTNFELEYETLLAKVRHVRRGESQALCADLSGKGFRRYGKLTVIGRLVAAPFILTTLVVALAVSHMFFMHELNYLITHHC